MTRCNIDHNTSSFVPKPCSLSDEKVGKRDRQRHATEKQINVSERSSVSVNYTCMSQHHREMESVIFAGTSASIEKRMCNEMNEL